MKYPGEEKTIKNRFIRRSASCFLLSAFNLQHEKFRSFDYRDLYIGGKSGACREPSRFPSPIFSPLVQFRSYLLFKKREREREIQITTFDSLLDTCIPDTKNSSPLLSSFLIHLISSRGIKATS